jgi:hypothetical protein
MFLAYMGVTEITLILAANNAVIQVISVNIKVLSLQAISWFANS